VYSVTEIFQGCRDTAIIQLYIGTVVVQGYMGAWVV
jgi:hypothetical protein